MKDSDLTAATMTRAARIMLPFYPVFCFWTGIAFVLMPPAKINASPALNFLDEGIHLYFVGLILLLIGGFQVLGLGLGRRWIYQAALAALWGIKVVLCVVFVGASFASNASYSDAAYPLFVAVAAWASLMSINSREAQP